MYFSHLILNNFSIIYILCKFCWQFFCTYPLIAFATLRKSFCLKHSDILIQKTVFFLFLCDFEWCFFMEHADLLIQKTKKKNSSCFFLVLEWKVALLYGACRRPNATVDEKKKIKNLWIKGTYLDVQNERLI